MSQDAFTRFVRLLADVMAGYGKPLPDAPIVQAWWRELQPFAASAVRQAFATYATERPDFAPVPNSIAARCRLLDGRPDENEAWAIVLVGRDERETVVWTAEMCTAFALCKPVLLSGDEVGARMAFKGAYVRLVAAARANNQPAVWTVSEGWDQERRALAVASAARAGLLPASPAHLALPDESGLPPARPEGMKRVLEALAQLEDPLEKAERHRMARHAAEQEAEAARKAEIAQQAAAYQHERRSA